ncbi:hypothetical protein [Sphingomonas beigongshangi]|uniref:hypothetical protein n=1 Tax=Sphingomonas beigongshangi TaxID=2782540 RepID=UPI001AEEB2EF|nr:hypothetical protein [Sphingomonas beigongshangi]
MALERAGTRVTSASITFAHAFKLGGDTRELPPGTYRIDTHEDMLCGAFDPVFVTTSVDLVVEHSGGITTRTVPPSDLLVAIAMDQTQSDFLEGGGEGLPTIDRKEGSAS